MLDTETYPKANLKQAWTPDEEADPIVESYRTPLTAPYPVFLPSEIKLSRRAEPAGSNPFYRVPQKDFTLPRLWQKQVGPFPPSGASEKGHQAGEAETICKF